MTETPSKPDLLTRLVASEADYRRLVVETGITRGRIPQGLSRELADLGVSDPGDPHAGSAELLLYGLGRIDLPKRRRREVASHLQDCAGCRERFDRVLSVVAAIPRSAPVARG